VEVAYGHLPSKRTGPKYIMIINSSKTMAFKEREGSEGRGETWSIST